MVINTVPAPAISSTRTQAVITSALARVEVAMVSLLLVVVVTATAEPLVREATVKVTLTPAKKIRVG